MAALVAAALTGCATTPTGTGFTKIKDYHLQEESRFTDSSDPMIPFERKHFLHGAVTKEEVRSRFGHYYTFFWNGEPGSGDVVVRFDYRQTTTGEKVHRLHFVVHDIRKRNQTRIRITGSPYHGQGRVVAWRITLSRDGRDLDSRQSFLWN